MSVRRPWVLLVLAAAGCTGKGPPPPAPPDPPVVTVEHPVERTLDSYAEFTGYLDAVERQQVRAQVTGYLQQVKFKDGDYVKKGQELFAIDPLPYRAAADSAKAAIARAEADLLSAKAKLLSAERDFARTEKSGGVSQQEVDTYRANRDAAVAVQQSGVAAIASAKANLVTAEFNLANCTVRSEVAGVGRVSRTQVTPGNLVSAGTTVLCSVTSLDPIYAYFVVDEQTSLAYRTSIFDKKEIPNPRDVYGPGLKCFVGLKDETGYPHAGKVDYAAPEILRGTGTREVRGTIPNPDPYRLGPGDSIRVRVESGAAKKLVTIPEAAVGSQQRQKFVYVVGRGEAGDEVAEFRPVTLGPVREVGGVRLQIVDAGLTPADRVVVNGLLRVRPGVPVKAELKPSPVPADAK
jgi:RND family efflux transporter MFP subunit